MNEEFIVDLVIFVLSLTMCRVTVRLLKDKPRVCRMLWIACFAILLFPWSAMLSGIKINEGLAIFVVFILIVLHYHSLPILAALLVSPFFKYSNAFLVPVPAVATAKRNATQTYSFLSRVIVDGITGDVSSPANAYQVCGLVYFAFALVLFLPALLFQLFTGFFDEKITLLSDHWHSDSDNLIAIESEIFLIPMLFYFLLIILAIVASQKMRVTRKRLMLSPNTVEFADDKIGYWLSSISIATFIGVGIGIWSVFDSYHYNWSIFNPIPKVLYAVRQPDVSTYRAWEGGRIEFDKSWYYLHHLLLATIAVKAFIVGKAIQQNIGSQRQLAEPS